MRAYVLGASTRISPVLCGAFRHVRNPDPADPLPEYTSLASIYAQPSTQTARYAQVASQFKAAFGKEPAFFVRAPGRVNIIGEHVDYHGCV